MVLMWWWPWMLVLWPLPWLVWLLPGLWRARSSRRTQDSLHWPSLGAWAARHRLAWVSQPRTWRAWMPTWRAAMSDGGRLWIGLAWTLLVLASARPMLLSGEEAVQWNGREIWVVLDVSASMGQRDMGPDPVQPLLHPTRLRWIQSWLHPMLEGRQGDRVGLVLFGSQAAIHTPMTPDITAVQEGVNSVEPGLLGPETALGDALALVARAHPDSGTAMRRVVWVLTDGDSTSGALGTERGLWLAEQAGMSVHVLSLGAQPQPVLESLAGSRSGSFRRVRSGADLAEMMRSLDAQDRGLRRQEGLWSGMEAWLPLLGLSLLCVALWCWRWPSRGSKPGQEQRDVQGAAAWAPRGTSWQVSPCLQERTGRFSYPADVTIEQGREHAGRSHSAHSSEMALAARSQVQPSAWRWAAVASLWVLAGMAWQWPALTGAGEPGAAAQAPIPSVWVFWQVSEDESQARDQAQQLQSWVKDTQDRDGARAVGVVIYGDQPYVLVPPTADASVLAHWIQQVPGAQLWEPEQARPELASQLAQERWGGRSAADFWLWWGGPRHGQTELVPDTYAKSVRSASQGAGPRWWASARSDGEGYVLLPCLLLLTLWIGWMAPAWVQDASQRRRFGVAHRRTPHAAALALVMGLAVLGMSLAPASGLASPGLGAQATTQAATSTAAPAKSAVEALQAYRQGDTARALKFWMAASDPHSQWALGTALAEIGQVAEGYAVLSRARSRWPWHAGIVHNHEVLQRWLSPPPQDQDEKPKPGSGSSARRPQGPSLDQREAESLARQWQQQAQALQQSQSPQGGAQDGAPKLSDRTLLERKIQWEQRRRQQQGVTW